MLIKNLKLFLFLALFTITIQATEEKKEEEIKNNDEIILSEKENDQKSGYWLNEERFFDNLINKNIAVESENFFKFSPKLWIRYMTIFYLKENPIMSYHEKKYKANRTYTAMPEALMNFIAQDTDHIEENNKWVTVEKLNEDDLKKDPYESYESNWQSCHRLFYNIFIPSLQNIIKNKTGIDLDTVFDKIHLSKMNNFGIILIQISLSHEKKLIFGDKTRYAIAISTPPAWIKSLTNEQKEFINYLNLVTNENLNKETFKNIKCTEFLKSNFSKLQIAEICHAYELEMPTSWCTIL